MRTRVAARRLASAVVAAAVTAGVVRALLAALRPERRLRTPPAVPSPSVATGPARARSPRLAAAAAAAGLLAAALVGAAFAYDASTAGTIAPGVEIAGVDVGGLDAAAARARLERRLERRIRPVVAVHGPHRFVLTPAAAGVHVDVDGAVDRALRRGRDGSFLVRALRRLTGRQEAADVAPAVRFSRAAAARFVARVETLSHAPRAARPVPSAAGLRIAGSRPGFAVDAAALRQRVERALGRVGGARWVAVPGRRLRPAVTRATLAGRYPAYIVVDRASFRLRLYEHLRLTRTYTIAVGQIGLETPAGLYRIQNKAVDPTWHVPDSAWAGSLAGAVVPPGPDNPLKARWLGIYGGAGIHGTDDVGSLGSAASHGCIRMAVPDVVDLYDRVPVGTPIYIA